MHLARACAALAAALTIAFSTTAADAQEKRVRMNMGGAFPGTMAILGPGQIALAERVKKMSGGSVDMRFSEPGALVPASQYFDAVRRGSLNSAWTSLGFFTGKDVAFAMFSSVPFGPETRRISRLDEARRRRKDDAGARRQVQRRGHAVRLDRAGSVRLVPPRDQERRRSQGPEDALLRARRDRDAEARRRDAAPASRRNLPGAAARHDRRDRVFDAGDGPHTRLPSGRQALLLPRLAPDVDLPASDHIEAEMGRALRRAEGDRQGRLRPDHRRQLRGRRGRAVKGDQGNPEQGRHRPLLDDRNPRYVPQDLARGRRGTEGQEP